LEPEMLESQSKVLSMRITAYFPKNNWAVKMAHWVGAQGQVQLAQNAKILPHF